VLFISGKCMGACFALKEKKTKKPEGDLSPF